ncbi:MAG: hypothetical protein ACTS6G_02820 [Candidatus Hodgkinia cicadicola]
MKEQSNGRFRDAMNDTFAKVNAKVETWSKLNLNEPLKGVKRTNEVKRKKEGTIERRFVRLIIKV